VAYDPAQIPAAKRPLLRLHLVEGSTVTEVPGSAVDLANNRVTAPVSHFSTYAILVPSDPSQVAITAGAGQTTFVEYEVPTAPSVTVRDAQGRPVARAKVSFDITAGGGRFRNGATQSSDTATTDANGIATLGARWRLGSSAGANTLTIKVFTAAGAQATTGTITATAQANPVARIVVSPDVATLNPGDSRQLTAVLYDARDTVLTAREITWSSANTAVATISSTGLVTALISGTSTISATSESQSSSALVTVAGSPFFKAENGITVRCPGAVVGDRGVVDGIMYTKRDRAALFALVRSGAHDSLSTSCTSGVTDMSRMFEGAGGFNSPIGTWDLSDVTTMEFMFASAASFNQPIGAWDVSKVRTMYLLFGGALAFNQPIGSWDVRRVTTMELMFMDAAAFNQAIGGWNVATVTDMYSMFQRASTFNRDISTWDVRNVRRMGGMFRSATSFNQPIGVWNVRSVVDFSDMFFDAFGFNQDLSGWCVINQASQPQYFDKDAFAWTLPNSRPVWGTCPVAVATVEVTPTAAALQVGGTRQLTAVPKDEAGNVLTGRTVLWSSSAPTVATVSATGTVTAIGGGAATITASIGGRTATAAITVRMPVATVEVTPSTATVVVGGTQQLTAVLKDAAGGTLIGPTVTWSSSVPAVATVSSTGFVAAVAVGTVTITATSEGRSATAVLTIVPSPVTQQSTISVGTVNVCGLATTGAAYCWGRNNYGQVGDGTQVDRSTPTAVSGGLVFRAITAGNQYACGLTPAGAAYCWGFNEFGKLGTLDGILGTPTAVSGGLNFQAITTAGGGHTCGLTLTGAAYCWGDNSYGQLGDGKFTGTSTPTLVSGGLTFQSIAAGMHHTCGLTTTGAAYCWGRNGSGRLGDGTSDDKATPTAVGGGLTYQAITAAALHTCGLASNGAAYCWGGNPHGQLGDGSIVSRVHPTAVLGGLTFQAITAWGIHTCGLTLAGAAYCWGENAAGEIGDGTAATAPRTPTAVLGGLTFQAISAGGDSGSGRGMTCALTLAGAAYCWGDNTWGQLGDGSRSNRTTPKAVTGGLAFRLP
jgi:alpha-tubulin suppressor-like RCC1 family protein